MAGIKHLYEGLFLLHKQASVDLAAASDHVRGLLERADAEIIAFGKWEERKLAYAIDGQRRGTYLIALFHSTGEKNSELDRDCNLSEQVLRAMITRADHMGEIEINQVKENIEKASDESKLRAESAPAASEDKPAPVEEAGTPAPASAVEEEAAAPVEAAVPAEEAASE